VLSAGFRGAALLALLIAAGILLYLYLHKVFLWPSAVIALLLPIVYGIILYLHERKGSKESLRSLVVATALIIVVSNFYYGSFDNRSTKNLAATLSPYLQPDDTIYMFNHYFQDLPVYIGRNVKIVNWTGELTHGINHQPNNQISLNENQLIVEWQKTGRKFLLAHIKELDYLKNKLNLHFYLFAKDKKAALICNQEVNK